MTTLTYNENEPSEIAKFADMFAELNRTQVKYKVKRAGGDLQIDIVIGAY